MDLETRVALAIVHLSEALANISSIYSTACVMGYNVSLQVQRSIPVRRLQL